MTLLNQLETAAKAALKGGSNVIEIEAINCDFDHAASPANILKLISEYRKAVEALKASNSVLVFLGDEITQAPVFRANYEAIQAYTVLEGK